MGKYIYIVICYYKDEDNDFFEIDNCFIDPVDATARKMRLEYLRIRKDKFKKPSNYLKFIEKDITLQQFITHQDKLKMLDKIEIQQNILI